ncbi:MAG TPA: GNAT family N-acetyltransferase [Thermoplasmata archaeon]|nr:GNAT family N-acetyltransferase [Thermoplasmata archaeon]
MFRTEFTANDGTTVIIREPTSSDARGLMRFINSIVREKKSGILIDKPITFKEEVGWLNGRLGDIKKKSTVMLTAEVDGKIVGNCDAVRRMWKERHRAEIGIALAKPARGKGIGKALMTACIELAQERMPGIERFDLNVLDYNERAQALYKSLGFVEICRIPDVMKEGNEYIGEYRMFLDIKSRKGAKGKKRA